MSDIASLVTKMEKHNSIFENSIRSLEVPVCAAFKDGGSIAPVSFEESAESISTKDTAKVNEQFPKTSAASKNKVLSGKGKNASPLKGKRVAVLFSGGIAYRQNAGLDANRDGQVTKAEAAGKVAAKYNKGQALSTEEPSV